MGESLEFAIEETESGWGANLNVGIIYTSPDDLPIGALVTCDATSHISTDGMCLHLQARDVLHPSRGPVYVLCR